MPSSRERLLVHHHAKAYRDAEGIWVSANIGSWIETLAPHFAEIGLLLFETSERVPDQDTCIRAGNVHLHSFGSPKGVRRRDRTRRIVQVCAEATPHYDVLLIRGITPRQRQVFEACPLPRKVFFLVGSLGDSRPAFRPTRVGMITWMMYYVRRAELRAMLPRCTGVLANAPHVVHEIARYFNVPATFVPTNSLRQTSFTPRAFRSFRTTPELLFCGRVVRDKGIEELIVALGRLTREGVRCTLRVIGQVDPAYRTDLERLAATQGVGAVLTFEGFVPFGPALLDAYRRADLYVLPTWHEGFPHSVWEAAASCTPIIVTPVGGIPSLVSEREVHFVPPRDARALAEGIKKVLSTPAEAERHVAAAHDLALGYTVERCAERLKNTIQRIHEV
ncbi:MAG TPA: glycosyltransferase family 4 protein [Prosthecobacter sp.]|nr:glycosyltransferase family 4 protein [Prosthecobacter sp.]